ncbi:hypothetical protein [Patulibacter minatonensis]|uniref:hypothetical protein n=1 Tax=Patulibacter minatonensis TaxID=298163 RepID=UPI00047CDA83|nr:hypothetical protein [Patulibacter minatonensis]
MSRISSTVRPTRATSVVLAGVAALTAFAGPAVAADAPVISAQKTWTGAKTPVSVPGNHLHKGDTIPKGAVLVYREVTVTGPTSKRRLVLTLPRRKGLTGIAVSEGSSVSVQVAKGHEQYEGKRRTVLTVQGRKGDGGKVTVYGYGR